MKVDGSVLVYFENLEYLKMKIFKNFFLKN